MSARGVTLVELLVVLALLALLVGVAGPAVASLGASPQSQHVRLLSDARARAIRSGVPALYSGDSDTVCFLPDGRALGPGVDPLTGALHGR